ncbi:MAG: hypothetical protein CVT67_10265 [Actinobacteria bacterium HGW-Actinobacteria-7]|nr:MAG: hypothetical protein CVT67_10265 [Actinobacteria bacterium HGW-Actinobacteria-7]
MNPTLLLVVLGVTMLVLVITFYQIYKKAGFNGIMGLLMLVPGVNLAAMLFVAFADWPVLKKVREIEQERAVAAAIAPPTAE